MDTPAGYSGYDSYHIVIADDDTTMADAVSLLLQRRMGVQCTKVHSGDDALRLLRTQSADCLITDMQMPGLHGIPLVEAVCAEHPNLPVVVMTGYPANFP